MTKTTRPEMRKIDPPTILIVLLFLFSVGGLWMVGTEINRLREGRMTTMERATVAQRAGDFTAAAVLWEQAANEGLQPITCLGEKAYCEYRAGKIDDALRTCDRIATLDLLNAKPHYIRGMIFHDRGDVLEAREEYRLALFNGDRTIREVAALQLKRLGE